MFTKAASVCFFSFSTLVFLSPALVLVATFTVLAASLASFSNLFASFLAEHQGHKDLCRVGEARIAPALLELKVGPSAEGGLETACSDDIVLKNTRDLGGGGKRYRCSSRIQFRSSHRLPFLGHVVACANSRSRDASKPIIIHRGRATTPTSSLKLLRRVTA